MIKNARQYAVSKQQLARLQEAFELSRDYPAEMDERIYKAMLAGIESQIQDVQNEIDEYEKLRETQEIPIGTFEDIGKLLIQARIAMGYNQGQLAEKAGMKPQAIQQYEANEYKSINLSQLKRIIKALGVSALVEFAQSLESVLFGYKNIHVATEPESKTTVENVTNNSNWLDSDNFSSSQWTFDKAA